MLMKLYALSFAFAICVCLIALIIVKFIADRYNLAKRKGEPSRMGGAGFVLAFLVVLSFLQFSKIIFLNAADFKGIVLGSFAIIFIGLLDDFKNLTSYAKLFFQICIGMLLVSTGIHTKIYFLPFWLNILLTVFWIVAIINAFNLLDILDGLAAGVAFISAATFLCLSLLTANNEYFFLCLLLIAVMMPFLAFNITPAKIFMGDTGSMFLGLFLAIISIQISYAPLDRPLAVLTPLLALGLPLYDIGFVSLMRINKGQSPMLKSNDHFSLRLVSLGFGRKNATVLMYLFCLMFSLLALVICNASTRVSILMLCFFLAVLTILSKKISLSEA